VSGSFSSARCGHSRREISFVRLPADSRLPGIIGDFDRGELLLFPFAVKTRSSSEPDPWCPKCALSVTTRSHDGNDRILEGGCQPAWANLYVSSIMVPLRSRERCYHNNRKNDDKTSLSQNSKGRCLEGKLRNSGAPRENRVTALSDNMLLERMGRGDIASFEALFYRHYDRVYGLLFRLVGNRVEAEDLTQEAFLKLYDRAFGNRLFVTGRKHNISAWLYRVATNLGYNAIRGRNRRWRRNTLLVPDADGAPAVDDEFERQEIRAAVRAALAKLQPRQAQLLLLRQMGLSYAECAEICEVAPGSVGQLLARAAKAFRIAYEEENGGE
jgi:RNA polymerase sigma-70 factor (ECF subfamily)